jgi:hemoglobin-like flavoprotein
MHRSSVEQVLATYPKLAPKLDEVARAFFDRLFEADAALRSLFPDDLARARQQLTASIALVWKNLDRLALLEAPLMELGRRYSDMGVTPGHYPVFRDAMLGAVEAAALESTDAPWPEKVREAWIEALNGVGAIMLKGAARAALDAAQHLSSESRPSVDARSFSTGPRPLTPGPRDHRDPRR